jgi:eukaryotic translation initiation factor 2C
MKLDYDNLPKLKAWGVGVQSQMMKLEARVLQPPQITYGGNKKTIASNG